MTGVLAPAARDRLLKCLRLLDSDKAGERAERRIGELMGEQRETVGLAKPGRPAAKIGSASDPIKPATLAEAGIDKSLADRARKMAAVPAAEIRMRADRLGVREAA